MRKEATLVCGECGKAIGPDYQLIVLLGHTKTGLVKPGKSKVSMIICSGHELAEHFTEEIISKPDTDAMIFAVIPAMTSEDIYPKTFSLELEDLLKSLGDFDKAKYVLDYSVKANFPYLFDLLMESFRSWPDEMQLYKMAIHRYLKNVSRFSPGPKSIPVQNKKKERVAQRNLRDTFTDLIAEVANLALDKKNVPIKTVRQLNFLDLLKPSTNFRRCSLFPGEATILFYKLADKIGFLGFNENLELISIDQRVPFETKQYRKQPGLEWTEIKTI